MNDEAGTIKYHNTNANTKDLEHESNIHGGLKFNSAIKFGADVPYCHTSYKLIKTV